MFWVANANILKYRSPILLLVILCVSIQVLGQIRYESSAQKLGTTFRVTCFPSDTLQGALLMEQVWKKVDSLDQVLSDYREDSEVTRLSLSAGKHQWIKVSDSLWDVLMIAQKIARQSEGVFDVTIGPLSKLWRRAFRRNIMPDPDQIEKAKSLVNYKWLLMRTEDQSVQLLRSGMRLDLGGIANGYILDRIYNDLSSQGMDRVLVDGGGDLYVGGLPMDRPSWKITWDGQEPSEVTSYTYRAVASSGDHYRYIEDHGIRYSHIIDPRSGYGITDNHHVVIAAPNCMLADALASTVSILGEDKGREILKGYQGSEILYIQKTSIP